MTGSLTILLVDDHSIFRKGLARIISDTRFRHAKILHAATGLEAIQLMEQGDAPDIIFMDVSMPEMNGYDCSEIVLRRWPGSKIIVLTVFDDAPIMTHFFRLGVRGYLTKNIDDKEIELAIDAILEGKRYCYPPIESVKLAWFDQRDDFAMPPVRFTPREMQLITLMSKGKTSDEIGTELQLSHRSVETYRLKLLDKAGVRNAAELCRFAFRNGII